MTGPGADTSPHFPPQHSAFPETDNCLDFYYGQKQCETDKQERKVGKGTLCTIQSGKM